MPTKRKNYGYRRDGRRTLPSHARRHARRSGRSRRAGYEDTFYYLWRERRLPVNVDPFDARLDDELERERLRRVFSAGLNAIVGHALPLARGADGTWRTGPWHLRGERMYLLPGDSAMGYRLPLDSLPWVSEIDYPYLREHDPFEQRPPLPRSSDRGAGLSRP